MVRRCREMSMGKRVFFISHKAEQRMHPEQEEKAKKSLRVILQHLSNISIESCGRWSEKDHEQ